MARCFDDALRFIRGAIDANTSKAAYLHGSFGSGKSHFLAILHLILRRDKAARSLTKLAAVIDRANEWTEGKKFLLVPYHMIGAKNMEAGILGGYDEFIREHHPEAPVPAIYLVDDLFRDAQQTTSQDGRQGWIEVPFDPPEWWLEPSDEAAPPVTAAVEVPMQARALKSLDGASPKMLPARSTALCHWSPGGPGQVRSSKRSANFVSDTSPFTGPPCS